jgi:hypothetical protein
VGGTQVILGRISHAGTHLKQRVGSLLVHSVNTGRGHVVLGGTPPWTRMLAARELRVSFRVVRGHIPSGTHKGRTSRVRVCW